MKAKKKWKEIRKRIVLKFEFDAGSVLETIINFVEEHILPYL